MPFITKYNFSKMIDEVKIIIPESRRVYKRDIYFLNSTEKERLLRIQEILQLGEAETLVFRRIPVVSDDKTLVLKGGQAAYHLTPSCETLNSEYLNFRIPDEIRQTNRVDEFRQWFVNNMYMLSEGGVKEEEFKRLLFKEFSVLYHSKIQIPNSGKLVFTDIALDDLEARIDEIISKAGKLFKDSSEAERSAIRKYGTRAFLYRSKYLIGDNDTGLSEDRLRQFLESYDNNFKTPIKDLLMKYYMVKYNPNLEFKGSLLEQVGFKKCSKCHN